HCGSTWIHVSWCKLLLRSGGDVPPESSTDGAPLGLCRPCRTARVLWRLSPPGGNVWNLVRRRGRVGLARRLVSSPLPRFATSARQLDVAVSSLLAKWTKRAGRVV